MVYIEIIVTITDNANNSSSLSSPISFDLNRTKPEIIDTISLPTIGVYESDIDTYFLVKNTIMLFKI